MEERGLLVSVFIPRVECCLLVVSRERWRVCLLNAQLPELLGNRRDEEGSLAPAEISRGRHTLARGRERAAGSEWTRMTHVVALEMRAQRWETGTTLPPPSVLPYPLRMQSPCGSVPGPSVVLLLSHLSLPSYRYRPHAAQECP